MKNIFVIAKNTLKLEIRDKILYGILAFALGYIALTIFFGQLTLGELQMIKSFGLAGIYFFTAIIALFLGTTSFYKDVDRKTVYFLVSKPVSRSQFLIGKYFGLCLVLLVASIILGAAYFGIVMYEGGGFDVIGLLAIFMQFLEMCLFIAFAICVASFSTSLISIVFTSAVFFIGHVVSALLIDAKAIGISGLQYRLVQAIYYVFPNLEKFNVRDLAIHAVAMPFTSFLLALAYTAAYVALLLMTAIWVFDRKEI